MWAYERGIASMHLCVWHEHLAWGSVLYANQFISHLHLYCIGICDSMHTLLFKYNSATTAFGSPNNPLICF